MPYKSLVAMVLATAIAANAAAQIEIKSALNNGTGWGNTKKFKEAPNEITVSQFNITFLTTRVAGATAGSNLKLNRVGVAMRAEQDLTPEQAQAVSDEAYAYFRQQLEAKGYTPKVHDLEALKTSKVYAKYAKKNDDASISPGGVVVVTDPNKVDERLAAHAIGVNGANLGRDPGTGYKGYTDLAMELGGKEGKLTVSIVAVVDFTEPAKKSSEMFDVAKASVSFAPSLRLIDAPQYGGQSAFNFHSASAIGGKFWGGYVWKNPDQSWLKEQERVNDGLLVYKLDPAAHKKAVLDLLRPFLDQMVERIDLAKKNGK